MCTRLISNYQLTWMAVARMLHRSWRLEYLQAYNVWTTIDQNYSWFRLAIDLCPIWFSQENERPWRSKPTSCVTSKTPHYLIRLMHTYGLYVCMCIYRKTWALTEPTSRSSDELVSCCCYPWPKLGKTASKLDWWRVSSVRVADYPLIGLFLMKYLFVLNFI
jgi:hypothetical protein